MARHVAGLVQGRDVVPIAGRKLVTLRQHGHVFRTGGRKHDHRARGGCSSPSASGSCSPARALPHSGSAGRTRAGGRPSICCSVGRRGGPDPRPFVAHQCRTGLPSSSGHGFPAVSRTGSSPATSRTGCASRASGSLGFHAAAAERKQRSCRSRGRVPSFENGRSVPSRARVRICSSRCAPRFVHCICWRLAKRLLRRRLPWTSPGTTKCVRRRGTARRS